MVANWDEINKCRLWPILGVSECDDCPSCKECWGNEVELPELTNNEALEKLSRAIIGTKSTHKEGG